MDSNSIITSLQELAAHERGELKLKSTAVKVPPVDVRKLRTDIGLSQEEFAARYNLALGTVRNWEQGVREPDGPGRMFLAMIRNDPDGVRTQVEKMLHAA